jgi:hypothetical protein
LGSLSPVYGVILITLVLFAAALAYLAHRLWRAYAGSEHDPTDLALKLKIHREPDSALLHLVLANWSKTLIWVEESRIVLTDVHGDSQGSAAGGKARVLVREFIKPDEILQVSVTEAVYEAAGRPQGECSFLVSGLVLYRLEDNWSEKILRPYWARMAARNPIGLRPMRWHNRPATKRSELANDLRAARTEAQDERIKRFDAPTGPFPSKGHDIAQANPSEPTPGRSKKEPPL